MNSLPRTTHFSRRGFLRGAAALASSFALPLRAENTKTLVYVGCYTARGQGISLYEMNAATGALDPLQKKKPVRKVRIDQHVQIVELHKKRRVPNPRDRHFARREFREFRLAAFTAARRQPRFPDHLIKERAWIEVVARR